MKRYKRRAEMAACMAALVAAGAHAHEGDFFVGHDGGNGSTTGRLAVEFAADAPFELPIVTLFPGDGFGADDPGFANLDVDEPAEDFYMLAGSPHIAFELMSFSPGLVMYFSPPLSVALQNPGDQFAMPAGTSFDDHGFWFINDPDFSETGHTFGFTFKAIDLNGQYADSPVYTAQFVAVPEPTAAIFGGVGALALIAQRRRRAQCAVPRRGIAGGRAGTPRSKPGVPFDPDKDK